VRINKRIALIAASFVLSVSSYSQIVDLKLLPTEEPITITFQDALRLGIEQNTDLKQTRYGIALAESDAQLAAAKWLPSASLSLSHNIDAKKNSTEEPETSKAGITVKAQLFDAKLLVELKAKQQLTAAARQKYLYEQDVLLRDVGLAYIEAFMAEATKEIAFEEQEQYRLQIIDVKKKVEVDTARPFEITQAEYRSRKAHADYLLRNQDFSGRMGELGQKIGVQQFFLLSNIEISSVYLDEDASRIVGLATNGLDIRVARAELKASSFSLLAEKLDFLPKLSVEFTSAVRLGSSAAVSTPTTPWNHTAMFVLDLPFGGSTFAMIKNKQANYAIKEIAVQAKTKEKPLIVESLKQQIKDSEVVEASADLALESATLAKKDADKLSELNEITSVEHQRAISDLFSAKYQAVNAHLKREQAKLKYLFEIGKIRELL